MSLYKHSLGSTSKPPVGITEFEILKASHKFLRDEDERPTSWDDQLAAKYYASLYREFALCDLKHYKSGNFALRWRTEDEVLSGAGETTCGNTRCEHHRPPAGSLRLDMDGPSRSNVPLTTLELPFGYVEQGESKSALVKVALCSRCLKKLMWKKTKEKEESANVSVSADNVEDDKDTRGFTQKQTRREEKEQERTKEREKEKTTQRKRSRDEEEHSRKEKSRKRRHTRSPSPQARDHDSVKHRRAKKH